MAGRRWPERLLPRADAGGGGRVLAIGVTPVLVGRLVGAGFLVDTLDLDLGPAAALHGNLAAAPVTAWAVPDGARDGVLLFDVMAHVVDDEAAIAEAARVLRPGGRLILRVPAAGPLAWLDAFNLYGYLRDATGRGGRLPETRGIGWRRHYRRRDVEALLGPRFRLRSVEGRGVGVAEGVRLVPLLLFRWLVSWDDADRRGGRVADAVRRVEERAALGRLGYRLVVVAERLPDGSPSI